jgi:hypothetical protein
MWNLNIEVDPLARVLGQLEAEYEDVMCVVRPIFTGVRDRRPHDDPALAPRLTRSSSSCANVSTIASAAPVPAASRASFEG